MSASGVNPGCPQCVELRQFVDTLRGLLESFTAHPEPPPVQATARSEQQCEDRHTRLNGTLLRCARPAGHGVGSGRADRTHSDGHGSSWAVGQ